MTNPPGVQLENLLASIDVQNFHNEYGVPVTVKIRNEGEVARDLYGSIAGRKVAPASVMNIGAYPYTHSPTQRQLEKAGLKEHCDLLIGTAYKDWTDAGVDPQFGFDMARMTVIADGVQWKIKERSHVSEYGPSELYVMLGLERM